MAIRIELHLSFSVSETVDVFRNSVEYCEDDSEDQL